MLLVAIVFGVQQEWLNHKFPSPDEWTWWTRKDFRNVLWEADAYDEGNGLVDWAYVGTTFLRILKRLEDQTIDGKGLKEQDEGGILVAGIGRTGFDITEKSEPWRRGYYEVLMQLGKSAEHLEGWVMDTTTRKFFPSNVVIGPSNPNPKPVPAGAKDPPLEENCVTAFDGPETYYMRILTTRGFTDKQRLDAALAYATYLDFKQTPDAALEVYKWALDIAASTPAAKTAIDAKTHILDPSTGPPSANLLSAVTAYAIHQAANNQLAEALPIFLSILRARRSLTAPPQTMMATLISDDDEKANAGTWKQFNDFLKVLITPPTYPPPPPDGNDPPQRTPKETCEEAGVMTYIGEILYASQSSKSGKEDGLAWTREAVDIAEEQLRKRGVDRYAKKTCAQCLEVGMGNWEVMVRRFADAEKAKKKTVRHESWLGFKGKEIVKSEDEEEAKGRWESEEAVVEERSRRVKDILVSVRSVQQSALF